MHYGAYHSFLRTCIVKDILNRNSFSARYIKSNEQSKLCFSIFYNTVDHIILSLVLLGTAPAVLGHLVELQTPATLL